MEEQIEFLEMIKTGIHLQIRMNYQTISTFEKSLAFTLMPDEDKKDFKETLELAIESAIMSIKAIDVNIDVLKLQNQS